MALCGAPFFYGCRLTLAIDRGADYEIAVAMTVVERVFPRWRSQWH
jgi:hypothetical protein